ncbi:MAG: hypothetical protein IPM42_16195 [Saprospiraceae bacterium]|nr:hypothetical protein [Saprospiraceae bacterium]
MKFRIFLLPLIIVSFLRSDKLCSQVILQLEIFKEVEAVKFKAGDIIHFKTSQFPKDWQKRKLEKIMQVDGVLLFDDGFIHVDDITHVRLYKPNVYALGLRIMQIGVVWWAYGGIIHLFTPNKFTWGTFAIGATAVGVGWLLKKFVSRRTFKIKKTANLRILDISFPTKEEWGKRSSIP